MLNAALHTPLVDLNAEGDPTVARDGKRLRAAHPAESAGKSDRAGQRPGEVLVGNLGEGRKGALQDALRTDVDPRAGGHLAVHDQAEVLQLAEVLRCCPLGHQQRVRDEHSRRTLVGPHYANGLATLDQQRVVGCHLTQ